MSLPSLTRYSVKSTSTRSPDAAPIGNPHSTERAKASRTVFASAAFAVNARNW